MSTKQAYDKAKWHFPTVEAAGLPLEQAYVHSGLFVGWLVDQNLLSDAAISLLTPWLSEFRERTRTGPELFRDGFDGVLADDDLAPEGRAFAKTYFDFDRGLYIDDYVEILVRGLPTQYHVEDTWANYDLLSTRINQRFERWNRGDLKPKRGLFGMLGLRLSRELEGVSPLGILLRLILLVIVAVLAVAFIVESCRGGRTVEKRVGSDERRVACQAHART